MPLRGQTWPTRFDDHSYNISAGGFGGYSSVFTPTATIPFSVTQAGDTATGTLQLRYPAALPDGIFRTFGSQQYLVPSSPITVGFHLEFDYVAAAITPAETVLSYLNVDVGSGSDEENPPCKVTNEPRQQPSGTTMHVVKDFSCTFSKLGGVIVNPAVPGQVIQIRNLIDFTTYPHEGFGGFLASVYSTYRTYSPLDLTVSRIEVVQVTQDVDNSVRLVADKSTAVRIFVGLGSDTAAIQPPQVGATLRGFNAIGAELPGSPLNAVNAPIRAPNRPDRAAANDSFFFKLPPEWTAEGTIKLRAEVNPDGALAETNRTNNTAEQNAVFIHRNEFTVRHVPICYLTNINCPSAFIDLEHTKMSKIFPVGSERLSYSRLKVPTWIYPYRFATSSDFDYLITLLRLRYEMANDSSIDQLVGWMPNLLSQTGRVAGSSDPLWYAPTDSGRVSWVMADIVASGDDYGEGVTANLLAHEIGHNLGLRHTNTADCGKCIDANTDWPDPSSGTVHEVGVDPQAPRIIPSSRFDVMTYRNTPGRRIWISPFHYNKLFDGRFRPMRETVRESAADATYAIVSGSARHDGTLARLDPMIVFNSSAPSSPPAPDGSHCIRFSGASQTLSDFCFNLSFHDHRTGEETEEAFFALRIPFQSGATRVSLRRGDSELATRAASVNAPTITITSPATGETWEGTRTIRWQGSDPDGDPLTYAVLYSSDGGAKWLPIEVNSSSNEFTFDTAEIASGSAVRFRVLATDGFRTTEATVGPLTVVAAPLIAVQTRADFGPVKLGEFGEAALRVVNHGEKALTIRAIVSSQGDFAVRENLPIVVAPDGSRAVSVRFTPAAEGVRAATLAFESDDPARPVVTSSLLGAGLATPQIVVTPASLAFGDIPLGGSSDLTVRVRNGGRGTLTVFALGSSSSQFAVRSPTGPLSLPGGAEATVTVTFRPASGGVQSGTLSLASSAPAAALTSVPLSGTGVGSGTGCQIIVSPASSLIPAEGGSRSVTVTAPAGCSWTFTGDDWLTVSSPATGTGTGTVSFAAGPNSGPPRSGVLAFGDVRVVIVQAGGAESLVMPAVASTPGALGSFFKTGVQLHNPTNGPISGDLIYHAAGSSGTADDPSLPYQLGAGQTVAFSDLLPALQESGLGSMDLVLRTGEPPVATIRIFNDAGDAGTTGMTEELLRPDEALEQGKTGVLIAPPEPSRARYNIGVRSLSFGATIRFSVRDASGAIRTTGAKFYPPVYFEQQTAETFLGLPLLANDTVTFQMDAGSAIVYGATTDNTTQDPSLQFARAISSKSDPRRTIAAVASAPGVNNSLFRTTLQLHNASSAAISGRLVFHPAGLSGTD
ncbi:MAG TPA: choice-of-anchor D domain-containing protein, partial [Thermoanaerobaculia bacterium]